MKRTIAILWLLLSWAHIMQAQAITQTDVTHEGLKGKVKSYSAYIYDIADSTGKEQQIWVYSAKKIFNKAGNLIWEKNVFAKTYFNDSILYYYDNRNYLTLELQYGEFHILKKRIDYTNDTSGNVLKQSEKEYEIDDSGKVTDSFITISTYYYNDLKLVKEIWQSELKEDGHMSASRLYTSNVYEDSGRIRHQYEYRSAEHPTIADTSYERRNKQYHIEESRNSQTHYLAENDSLGRLTVIKNLFLKSNKVRSTFIYTYDKWGNRNSSTSYDSTGKIMSDTITSTHYNIDGKGNWRKAKSYKDGKLVYYCRRRIVYY